MSNNKERKDIGFKETRPIYVDFKQDCIREGIDCNEQLTKLMEGIFLDQLVLLVEMNYHFHSGLILEKIS